MNTLYISDLDGTLLRDDATLSGTSRSMLRSMIADGLSFSVASARSVVSMQDMLAGLDLDLPVIEFNGAFISDLHTGKHLVINALDPAVAEAIFSVMQRRGCTPFVSTFDGSKDRLYHNDADNDGEQWHINSRHQHNDHRISYTSDFAGPLAEDVVCLTTIGKNEALIELEAEISAEFDGLIELHRFHNPYSPGWFWLTVHDRRATKDQAAQTLMREFGLVDHELVVFGDEVNDVKLFQLAKHSIAVANAINEVKQHASQVIGSNNDDSVVKFIRSHSASGGSR